MRYTVTAYIYNHENGEYDQSSADDLDQLATWVTNRVKNSVFDIEVEFMDNDERKIIKKISYKANSDILDPIL